MKKILLALLIFTGAVFSVNAQDLIIKKDGSEVRAKVTEIVPDAIKYKMFNNQDGPVYVLPKSEIFMIKYESGRKEVFGAETTSSTGTTTSSSTGTTTATSTTGTTSSTTTAATSTTGTAKTSSAGLESLPTFGAKSGTTTTSSSTATPSTSGAPAGTVATPPSQQRTPVAQYSYQSDWKARMQATAPDVYRKYRKGSTLAGVGIGLMSAGFVAVIAGVATGEKSTTRTATSISWQVEGTGGAVAVIGSFCVLAGTPLMIVGFSKKSKAKREYFSQYGNRTEYKSPLQAPHLEVRPNGLAFVF
jgi:hypothetical protein